MAQERYTLFDNFEYKGKWWLPEKSQNAVAGVLQVTSGNIVLELLGSLRGSNLHQHFGGGEVFSPKIIHGITDNGNLCTLMNSYLKDSKISLPAGLVQENYIVNFLIVGELFNSVEEVKLESISVNYSLLEEWLSISAFKQDFPSKGKPVEARFTFPESFEVFIGNIYASISLDGKFHTGGDNFRTLKWDYTAFIKIAPSGDKSLDWFIEQLHSIASVLTLFTGEPVYPRQIKARISGQNKITGRQAKEPIEIFYELTGTESPRALHPFEMIIPFPLVRGNIGTILSNWFEKSSLLSPTINLFISMFYKSKIYTDSVFLSLMQAVESYCRRRYEGRYVTEQGYKQYLEQIILPDTMPSELKESLRNRLEYGNEYSLRKRFEKLFDILESKLKNLITDNTDAFINSVVDTRNYLTHYDKKLEEKRLQGADLYYANQRLALLLTTILLKEIGISEDIIHKRVLQTRRFAGLRQKD